MSYELSLLKVPVSKIKLSIPFYVEVIGFELEFQAEQYGWAQLTSGNLGLALYEPNKGGGNRVIGGSIDFHLKLKDKEFDELAKKVADTTALVDNQIHSGNDGSTFMELIDLDGNILKIMKC